MTGVQTCALPICVAPEPLPIILHDLTLNIRPGELVIVVGSVGCGKSSLLAALLGEMNCVAGVAPALPTVAALSSQKAWILSGTVKDNIVLERPFDAERYAQVVRACQLVSDINNMHAGDNTEIGERGTGRGEHGCGCAPGQAGGCDGVHLSRG